MCLCALLSDDLHHFNLQLLRRSESVCLLSDVSMPRARTGLPEAVQRRLLHHRPVQACARLLGVPLLALRAGSCVRRRSLRRPQMLLQNKREEGERRSADGAPEGCSAEPDSQVRLAYAASRCTADKGGSSAPRASSWALNGPHVLTLPGSL